MEIPTSITKMNEDGTELNINSHQENQLSYSTLILSIIGSEIQDISETY